MQSQNALAAQSNGNNRSMLGYAGLAGVLFSLFAPIASLPIVGSVTFFSEPLSGWCIALFAAIIIGALGALRNRRGLLLVASAITGAVALLYFVGFQYRIHEIKNNLHTSFAGNPFSGLAEAAVNSVRLDWGIAVLIIAALLLLAAALMGSTFHAVGFSLGEDVRNNRKTSIGVIGAILVLVLASGVTTGVHAFQASQSQNKLGVLKIESFSRKIILKDYEQRRYNDQIEVLVTLRNTGKAPIKAYKGDLIFKDDLGDTIDTIGVSHESEGLDPGKTEIYDGTIDYNEFRPEMGKLRDTPIDQIHTTWKTTQLLFVNGETVKEEQSSK